MNRLLFGVVLGLGCLVAQSAFAQGEGGEEETGLWEMLIDGVENITTTIHNKTNSVICASRVGMIDAISEALGISCTTVDPPEGSPPGTPAQGGCQDAPEGGECELCQDWLGDHKHWVSEVISWVIGGGNVFLQFLPWELWSFLMIAYLFTAATIWFLRTMVTLGQMMLGVIS